MRTRTFKQEHPDGLTQKKRLRADKVNTKDLEHEYDTLPPLENLTIHCEESISLEVVGRVVSVVDCLVVVQSDVAVALDFDSVLFDKDRNSIGVVFDLFGPVKSPLYSIRFNSKEEAAKMTVGMKVYYAPTAEAYTKKVIEENIKERTMRSNNKHFERYLPAENCQRMSRYSATMKRKRNTDNGNPGQKRIDQKLAKGEDRKGAYSFPTLHLNVDEEVETEVVIEDEELDEEARGIGITHEMAAIDLDKAGAPFRGEDEDDLLMPSPAGLPPLFPVTRTPNIVVMVPCHLVIQDLIERKSW
ncbi:unnamed protein product [Nippostrongylus brasiliensis]|uniref:H/ACA ribonucleoprotein complex subunit n=1 Tax=Nippostrongylus brasiliensis TaxID=27835 RepID=A0A0N4Y3R2_NIPBR|nr:unnamed protein product [Nippostrongylus brasiliensis]